MIKTTVQEKANSEFQPEIKTFSILRCSAV